jgi:ornithine--oxo-acid transaminase
VAALAGELSSAEVIRLTETYGAHNYDPLPVNLVRAEGAWVYDDRGRAYLDCIGAYSALAHGHLSPFLVETMQAQVQSLTLTSRAVYNPLLALFLEGLNHYTGFGMACPMNTGAEAVETALKLTRKWAYTRKGVTDGRAQIVVADGNFHGRTTTIVGFSSEPAYRRHFGPFTPGFSSVPFGDAAALEAALTPETAAVLLEPIQAEAGIVLPPPGYLAGVRRLCRARNVLLIWDEIQTGFCRTGRKFAWQHEDARPDLMCLGKALGGGLVPVAAVVGDRDVLDVFEPGDHGSTFGGNPLGAAVALAAMAEMETEGLAERSAAMGERLMQGLRGLRHPAVQDVRGRGLLVGLEVTAATDTRALADAFLAEGLLTKETRSRTFRLAPPLVIESADVDEITARVGRALGRLGCDC